MNSAFRLRLQLRLAVAACIWAAQRVSASFAVAACSCGLRLEGLPKGVFVVVNGGLRGCALRLGTLQVVTAQGAELRMQIARCCTLAGFFAMLGVSPVFSLSRTSGAIATNDRETENAH